MASLLDSEPQFAQRTLDLRLSEELRRGLKRANLQTFGTYAYSHGQPGQKIVDEAFETWLTSQVLMGPSWPILQVPSGCFLRVRQWS